MLHRGTDEPPLALDPFDRGALGPFLTLYPGTLADVVVGIDATLRLTFASGAALAVPADPSYEAWQVNGPGNLLLVCEPGSEGQLSAWS